MDLHSRPLSSISAIGGRRFDAYSSQSRAAASEKVPPLLPAHLFTD